MELGVAAATAFRRVRSGWRILELAQLRPPGRLKTRKLVWPGIVVITLGTSLGGMLSPVPQASSTRQVEQTVAVNAYALNELRPPLAPPDAGQVPVPAAYTVQEGDTLLAIAYRFGSSPDAIQLASGLRNADMLRVGQQLTVPPAESLLQTVNPALTVRELASGYEVEPRLLAAYNGLPNNAEQPIRRNLVVLPPGTPDATVDLSPGPRPPARGPSSTTATQSGQPTGEVAVYTVEEGDTLVSIASRHGVPPATIVAANSLPDSDLIIVGTELAVPVWSRPAERVAAAGGVILQAASANLPSAPARPQSVVYEVAPGDTVTDLASRFGVDSETIVGSNDLSDPDVIQPGEQLTILPVSGLLYQVQPGDTLESIAKTFRVDLGPIIDFNYMDDLDLISVGQELILPGAKPLPPAPARAPGPVEYVVTAGDTVSSIAARFGVAPADVVAANRLRSADRLSIGDTLTIVTGAGSSSARAGASSQTVTRNLPMRSASPSVGRSAPPARGGGTVVSNAMGLSGSKYVFGGTTPAGFDCSGFVYYVMNKSGKGVGRGMWGQYNAGAHVGRGDLQPGDMVFFQNTYMAGLSHNGIYVGGGQFIHAVDERSGVKVSSLSEGYWASRWFGATRVN